MPARISKEEAIARLKRVNYPEMSVDISTYRAWSLPCRFVDSEYGDWWPIPGNVANGCLHPARALAIQAQQQRVPLDKIMRRIEDAHGDEVRLDESTYESATTRARFIDQDFGEFYALPGRVAKGHGHPHRGRQRYGEAQRLGIEEVERRLKLIHSGKVRLQRDSYQSFSRPAVFIHEEYGAWTALVSNVIDRRSSHPEGTQKRIRETHMKNLGVANPLQSPEIFRKVQLSRRETIQVPHWQDGSTLLCRGSYEYCVVLELNRQRIPFKWQIEFEVLDGRVYYCDLHLLDQNLYVEIKGYFCSSLNLEKWIDFHLRYPNSELWELQEVLSFTGLSRREMRLKFVAALAKEVKDG